MGITNYHKFAKSVYADSHKNKWLDSYDNIYFDLNSLLHKIAHISTSTENIITRLKEYMNNIIKLCPPCKRVIITADGEFITNR